jgi:hypothetical protein
VRASPKIGLQSPPPLVDPKSNRKINIDNSLSARASRKHARTGLQHSNAAEVIGQSQTSLCEHHTAKLQNHPSYAGQANSYELQRFDSAQ